MPFRAVVDVYRGGVLRSQRLDNYRVNFRPGIRLVNHAVSFRTQVRLLRAPRRPRRPNRHVPRTCSPTTGSRFRRRPGSVSLFLTLLFEVPDVEALRVLVVVGHPNNAPRHLGEAVRAS